VLMPSRILHRGISNRLTMYRIERGRDVQYQYLEMLDRAG